MEGHHPAVHQVVGRLLAAVLRVHKVVQIVHVRMRLAVEDPIVLAQRVQVFPNLQQTVAVVRFHLALQWADLVIPRVFVHELLNR